jgi:MGT family glycosyltransferase
VETPEWLASLRKDHPVVYVTEGTVHVAEPVTLCAAAAGLAGLPMHVILSTGEHRRPEEINLGATAPNIRVEQFIPHEPLFEKTDLIVTTGGAGTIAKALLAGIPILIIPVGWEHAENAQRIVEAGVGLRLEPKDCTPAAIRCCVNEILSNPKYRQNAQRVGREMEQQGGAERGAELLEGVVATHNAGIARV